jgi:hypothetical protein
MAALSTPATPEEQFTGIAQCHLNDQRPLGWRDTRAGQAGQNLSTQVGEQ